MDHATLGALERLRTDFAEMGGSVGKPLEDVARLAGQKAAQYRQLGNAYVDLQPGNGTSYKMVLHDLVAPAMPLARRENRVTCPECGGAGTCLGRCDIDGMVPDPLGSEEDLRAYAYRRSMAGRLGGELLVSLPENGGRSFTMSLPAFVVPGWLQERGFRPGDAYHLAIFLTMFSEAVCEQRS